MKPEIGTEVYCLYRDGILVNTVAFIGNESFIVDSFGCCTEEDSWEWYYEDYKEKWFTDLNEAKIKLILDYDDEYDGNLRIAKISDDWYQLEDDNDE